MAKLNKVVGSVNNDLSIVVPSDTNVIKTLKADGRKVTSFPSSFYFMSVIDGSVRMYVSGHNYNTNIRAQISLATSEDGFVTEYMIISSLGNQSTITKTVDVAIKRGVIYKVIFSSSSTSDSKPYLKSLDIRGTVKEINPTQIVYNY